MTTLARSRPRYSSAHHQEEELPHSTDKNGPSVPSIKAHAGATEGAPALLQHVELEVGLVEEVLRACMSNG
jgi:hypothetical protein